MPVFIDIETRSACDLKEEGGYKYAAHPTTRLLTVAFRIGAEDHVWLPGLCSDPPGGLRDLHLPDVRVHVGEQVPVPLCRAAGREWIGHNSWTFDRPVWLECTEGFEHVRWLDTYPLALAAGLPGGLDKIGKLLWGAGKYEAGAKELKKGFRATGPGDCEPENVPIGRLILIAKYNVQDVRLTAALWDRLQQDLRLTEHEQRVLAAHDAINDRGCRIDRDLVLALARLSDQSRDYAVKKIAELTDGELPDLSALQGRKTMLAWLDKHGISLQKNKKPSLAKELVARFIEANRSHEDIEEENAEGDAAGPPDEDERVETRGLSRIVNVLELRMQALRITGGKLDAALWAMQRFGEREFRARGLFAYHSAHCVTGDHELLTPDGWVRIDKWAGGPIAQWEPDGGTIRFSQATPNRFETDEPTVTLRGPYASGVFTQGHRVPTYNTVHKFVERSAGDMPAIKQADLPLSGLLTDEGSITPLQMRILVAVQADGHWVTDTRQGRGLQFTFRKQRKIDRIKLLFGEAGIPYRIQEFPSCPGQFRVSVRWKDIPVWLTPERKKFGPWLLDSTKDARSVFLQELRHWDGHDSGFNTVYYSSDPTNHEWAATLAHLAGAAMAPARYSTRTYVSTLRRTHKTRSKGEHWVDTAAAGIVYCPTTETGYWVYRHRGKIAITGNTGRWAGRRIQVQNLPRPKEGVDTWKLLGMYEEHKQLEFGAVVSTLPIGERGADGKLLYPFLSPDDAAAGLLRGIFLPNEGDVLIGADYAAIEARVLEWMAGGKGLRIFWDGGDPYLVMAERIFGPTCKWPQFPDPKKAGAFLPLKKHPYRQVGKVVVLGSGYQLGSAKFAVYAAVNGIDLDAVGTTPEACILAYRTANPLIAGEYMGEGKNGRPWFRGGLWYDLNQAVLTAVTDRTTTYAGRCVFFMRDDDLLCRLPSGRHLTYRLARVDASHPVWCEKPEGIPAVTYWSPRYGRKTLYGGCILENCLAADTKVLTDRGPVPIIQVTRQDRVWDGIEWVAHGGCAYRGDKETGTWLGVRLTADHLIHDGKNWKPATLLDDRSSQQCLKSALRSAPWSCESAVEGRGVARIAPVRAGGRTGLRPVALCAGTPKRVLLVPTPPVERGWPQATATGTLSRTRNCSFSGITPPSVVPGTGSWHSTDREESVYDLLNCGPRHRFMILTDAGPVLVHNCDQAISRDIMAAGMVRVEEAGALPVVLHCHDEIVSSGREERCPEFMRLVTTCPDWLDRFPLDAEGGIMPRYSKTPPPGVKEQVWRNGTFLKGA